jgi:hypothetical protein
MMNEWSRHSPGRTEENHENPPEYEVGVLITQPRRSVLTIVPMEQNMCSLVNIDKITASRNLLIQLLICCSVLKLLL